MSRNVLAISAVGDLEAIAISIPFSFNACTMPLAWGYKDGISRLDRHSLEKKKFENNKLIIKNKEEIMIMIMIVPVERPESVIQIEHDQSRKHLERSYYLHSLCLRILVSHLFTSGFLFFFNSLNKTSPHFYFHYIANYNPTL